MGKTGQGILALYVAEQVNEGPISNIMYNFELTTSIVICHLELQGQMAAQKLTVLTGPAEMLFEKHFGEITVKRVVVIVYFRQRCICWKEDDKLVKVSAAAFSG